MENKIIVSYLGTQYCILVPKYYEREEKPSWVKAYVGTKEECERKFKDFPDYYKASAEENREMREIRLKEYLFMKSLTSNVAREKRIAAIQKMYGFN